MDDLRALTSIELFLHSDFYCKHPSFVTTLNAYSKLFCSVESILKVSVSEDSFSTGLNSADLIKSEALRNCTNATWSSFVCILGLSSVISKSIHCIYPDFGLVKYKKIFNGLIKPRGTANSSSTFYLLFCSEKGIKPGISFKPDHFVPLISSEKYKKGLVRKSLDEKVHHKGQTKLSFWTDSRKRSASTTSTSSPVSHLHMTACPQPTGRKVSDISEVSEVTLNVFNDAAASQESESTSVSKTAASELEASSSSLFSGDISTYYHKAKACKNDNDKFDLIKNVYVPDKSYPFKKTKWEEGFVMSGLVCFLGYAIHLVKMEPTVYIVLCLVLLQ